MVVNGEAACPVCFTENQYSIFMNRGQNGRYECRFGHKFKEDSNGYLKPLARLGKN
ncbi:TPA: hypothetical protein HA244_04060 [Candidatus Micrarchaeota archaeon]|nr:hypothetical protein [Candidatus Micrarchaeota archaeon]